MKKIISMTLLLAVTSTTFAISKNITAPTTQSTIDSTIDWVISQPSDTVVYRNNNGSFTFVNIVVSKPTDGNIPDDATVTCDGEEFVIQPGNGLGCPLEPHRAIEIKDVNFKNGTRGKLTVN